MTIDTYIDKEEIMIHKVLVVVPHQDDELNVAGFLLEWFRKNNIEINILYVTKGNFYPKKYEARINERNSVLEIFGNIFYKQLDYNDSYKSAGHIYNDENIRRKLKEDIKSYFEEVWADLVIYVDYDLHADHRMVSGLCDEILRELIVERQYQPIVLKKFAYVGSWMGPSDYFSAKVIETMPVIGKKKDDYYFALPNQWDDRIRLETEKEDYALSFWKSKVFVAYKTYFTQCGYKHFFKAANSDIVYWYRNTKNVMLFAKFIKASSNCESIGFVNDFRILNVKKITEKFEIEKLFSDSAWIPEAGDKEKRFIVYWDDTVTIQRLKLYQVFITKGHIHKFKIELDNGYEKVFTSDTKDVEYFEIDKQIGIKQLKFTILESEGFAGIRELEIYEDMGEFPWEESTLKKYDIEKVCKSRKVYLYIIIEKFFWLFYRAKNKVLKMIGRPNWD